MDQGPETVYPENVQIGFSGGNGTGMWQSILALVLMG